MTELWARVLRRYRFKGGLVRPRVPLVLRRAAAAQQAVHRTLVTPVSARLSINVRLSWPQWMPSTVRRQRPESPAAADRRECLMPTSTRPLTARAPLRSFTITQPIAERAAAARAPAERIVATRDSVANLPSRPPLSPLSLMPTSPATSPSLVDHRLASASAARRPSAAPAPMSDAPLEHRHAAATTDTTPRRTRSVTGMVTPVTARRVIAITSPPIRPAVRVAAQESAIQPAVDQTVVTAHRAPSQGERDFGSLHGEPVARTFAAARPPGASARSDSSSREMTRSQVQSASRPAVPALPPAEVARLSEEVYRHIERRARIERERRGI